MDKIVLFCKTYNGDLDRFKVLLESVKKYNRDNIPFYISISREDEKLFNEEIDTEYVNILFDDDIVQLGEEWDKVPSSTKGWYIQQIVKSSFWKLDLCENYIMIDSDSYFIKDFYVSDFMYTDEIPYTVMHEQKNLFEFSSRFQEHIGHDPQIGFIEEREKIMKMFKREGKIFDFGPGPVIWSCAVWKLLSESQLEPNDLTIADLIKVVPSEFSWYGEFLLKFRPIPIIPIEPMFKFFHFLTQYDFFKKLDYKEETFAKNYLGLVMQSNWKAPLKY